MSSTTCSPEETTARSVVGEFGSALERGDVEAAANMFEDDGDGDGGGYWRDLVSFTWNIATFQGPAEIRDMLRSQLGTVKPSNWKLNADEKVTVDEDDGGIITAWIEFETSVARGCGIVRLRGGKGDDNKKKIWTLLTTMVELKGYEEARGVRRVRGVEHQAKKNRTTWLESKLKNEAELGLLGTEGPQPYCVIIGGGQGGIALGARLRQLNVPCVILERNQRPGDSWRNRYKSLCLHDPVWYDHMPYLPFPDNWPVFSPKDKMGDWLEMYTKIMELNYWTSSTAKSAAFDEKTETWSITVDRGGKQEIVLKPKQVVMATGMSGKPNVPNFPGTDTFRGEQHHSSRHPGPDAYSGKKCVVIGSNNSAHDICGALWEASAQADVTMVQRSSTLVARSEPLMEIALGDLYSERAVAAGITTDKADLIFASLPYAILPQLQIPQYAKMKDRDTEFYEELQKAGFWLDWGENDTGLFLKYLRRGSGYYIDVGTSQLIIDGKIKLKRGQVVKVVPEGVVLDTGETLPADLIVYATGYNSMNGWVEDIMGKELADKVGKVWGLGSDTTKDPGPWEGELRNMWKPTQQTGLWFQGGNLHQSRHYSQFLALQIKARMENLPTPVYGLGKVHHVS